MGTVTALPGQTRTVGSLTAADMGTRIRFLAHGRRRVLRLACVHHDYDTTGKVQVTYVADRRGASFILPSNTAIE